MSILMIYIVSILWKVLLFEVPLFFDKDENSIKMKYVIEFAVM